MQSKSTIASLAFTILLIALYPFIHKIAGDYNISKGIQALIGSTCAIPIANTILALSGRARKFLGLLFIISIVAYFIWPFYVGSFNENNSILDGFLIMIGCQSFIMLFTKKKES